MSQLPDAEKRVRRIRLLTAELLRVGEHNTMKSRARCKTIALELIELLKAEDEYQRERLAEDASNVA